MLKQENYPWLAVLLRSVFLHLYAYRIAEGNMKYVMFLTISVLIDVIYHPAVKKKLSPKKDPQLMLMLRFVFIIRIKENWLLSLEKCYLKCQNTHCENKNWLTQCYVNCIFVSSSVKMTSRSNSERVREKDFFSPLLYVK